MDFYVDKTRVTEGDVVEVKWKCPKAESVKITIDNGYKSASADVEKEGSKKYKLNRSNGQTIISLDAVENGKPVKKELKIKVKRYDNYERIDRKPLREKLDMLKTRFKYFWQALLPQKKQAYILLLIIFVIMIISSFYPQATFFGMSLIAIYLLWTLMKK